MGTIGHVQRNIVERSRDNSCHANATMYISARKLLLEGIWKIIFHSVVSLKE